MNTNEMWLSALGELELQLSKANFTTWFKNTFIVSCENGDVYIGVPNAFTKAWLEKKYHREIFSSLQKLSNNKIKSVCFRVESKISPPKDVKYTEEGVYFDNNDNFQSAPQSYQVVQNEASVNQHYTFGNFVVGKQNELAHAAAQAVSSQPGDVYNPLFIYGGVGLGKTHLLQAIGNEIISKNPRAKILYATCERFTNDFIHAVRTGHAKEFKDQYRTIDLLMIDDIQFITGKEGTQEEFFHTFNHLHQMKKQIIITSDRPPKAIPGIESRLLSRFEWGMMADIGNPDFETRVAILENKCREKNYLVEREIVQYISSVIQSNVRELEGALNKIIVFHQFKNLKPTMESVKPILTSFQPIKSNKNITPKQLIQTVSLYFDVKIEDLIGKSREKHLAFPRQIIMFLMREEMKCSYPSIGQEIGGRDHTTAMHAYEKISGILNDDERLQNDIELIKQRLYTV